MKLKIKAGMPEEYFCWAEINISEVSSTRCIIAWNNKQGLVGIVTWDDEYKTLENLNVQREFRRQKFGTKLVQLAEKVHGGPLKDTGERSTAGEALWKSMGKKPVKLRHREHPESSGAMLSAWIMRQYLNENLASLVIGEWQLL